MLYLAADESLTMDVIFAFLKIKPTWPALSFCKVIVLSKGLSIRIVKVSVEIIGNMEMHNILKSKFMENSLNITKMADNFQVFNFNSPVKFVQ